VYTEIEAQNLGLGSGKAGTGIFSRSVALSCPAHLTSRWIASRSHTAQDRFCGLRKGNLPGEP